MPTEHQAIVGSGTEQYMQPTKDRIIVDYFVQKFADTDVKPVLMEYEKWSRKESLIGSG
jgi:hypothetical protein